LSDIFKPWEYIEIYPISCLIEWRDALPGYFTSPTIGLWILQMQSAWWNDACKYLSPKQWFSTGWQVKSPCLCQPLFFPIVRFLCRCAPHDADAFYVLSQFSMPSIKIKTLQSGEWSIQLDLQVIRVHAWNTWIINTSYLISWKNFSRQHFSHNIARINSIVKWVNPTMTK
jgi:hypothetical protein